MIKLWFISLFLLFLVGCKADIAVNYENSKLYQVYAVHEKSFQVELVEVEYPITDTSSIFHLYTIYQNHLPVGYISPASPNVELLEVKQVQQEIFYTVNQFIYVSNIAAFKEVLQKTSQLYGYDQIHILHLLKEL